MAARAAAGRSKLALNAGRQHSHTIARCRAGQAQFCLQHKVMMTGASSAAGQPRHQQLLGPVTLAACLLLGNAAFHQPAAQAAVSGAPAEHEAGLVSAAARLHLRPMPCLAHISSLQLVGPAAAAEDVPTETGAAAEDDDIGTSISGVLVFTVVCFTLTRKGSSSRSSSGSNRRGDYFDWDEDDRFWNDDD